MCEFARKTRDSGHTREQDGLLCHSWAVRRRGTRSLSEEAARRGQRGRGGPPAGAQPLSSTELKGGTCRWADPGRRG